MNHRYRMSNLMPTLLAGALVLVGFLAFLDPLSAQSDPRHREKPHVMAAGRLMTVPGERLVSIAITAPSVDDASGFWNAYERALDVAIEAGMHLPGELSLKWSEVERKGLFGKLSYADPSSESVIDLIRKRNLPLVLTISPFETMNSRIPRDLERLPYDHPKLLARLRAFIDWTYALTEGVRVVRIVLGNEFDVHLALSASRRPERWRQLEAMVIAMREHIRTKGRWASVPFALEATYAGLVDHSREPLKALNRHADIVGVSFYPLSDGRVKSPFSLETHLQALFQLYPAQPVDFYQYGYPSSEAIGGSLEKQRQFIEESFRLWDAHKDKIRIVTFTWLHDVRSVHISSMTRDTIAKGVDPGQAFAHFLGSLGLIGHRPGDEKPAFRELKRQIGQRAWKRQ